MPLHAPLADTNLMIKDEGSIITFVAYKLFFPKLPEILPVYTLIAAVNVIELFSPYLTLRHESKVVLSKVGHLAHVR